MLKRIRQDEGGFTLIELLVVILIIGILAAIALPSFLGQQTKGQDSEAKSNARNMVSQVESCFAETQDYRDCVTTGDPPAASPALGTTGLEIGTDGGQVVVASGGRRDYVITATSKSTNEFIITKTGGGAPVRTCNQGPDGDGGGCSADGASW